MSKPKPKPVPSAAKNTKVQIRLGGAEKKLIERAAKVQRTTLSAFLLDNARAAAQQVLADQVEFILSPDRWEAFCKALDAPPKVKPALKKLLREASVFDGDGSAAAR